MTSEISILVPTINRPGELLRLIRFFSLTKNTSPVLVLDGSDSNIQKINQENMARFAFVAYKAYEPRGHLGVRIARGLEDVSTPYCVICADDDFVFPSSLPECIEFLKSHPDYSTVLGKVLTLRYLKHKPFFKRGFMIGNHLGFVGYMGHQRFLVRALYYFAYTHLGSTPLFYGVRNTAFLREIFAHVTPEMKYTGLELWVNAMSLIRGKIKVLRIPFGLRDYSAVSTSEPLRADPEHYFSKADIDYIAPLLTRELAHAESLEHSTSEAEVKMFIDHLFEFDEDTKAPVSRLGLAERLKLALKLSYAAISPVNYAAAHDLPADIAHALSRSLRSFVNEH